ncbi:MAG: diadenylate cyclase CdaA [Clostridiales bacterium]|jgi:diadenylate cyclase|nr:diadenylate cyclase CdaA [Clostridiales bacterium]
MIDLITNLFTSLPPFAMPHLGLNSILDILFITFVLYRVLIWIKQTRGWTLFKGILTIALIYLGAVVLLMHATVWIIQQSLTVAAIAAVIIFQPEIRKALENLGKNRSIPFFNPLEENKEANSAASIEEIIDAAQKMADVNTGALIVIEQQVPLGDLEESGVAIDAIVTSQLLVNIFEHNTPLHDGAVLIRANRVKAATCILPLTTEALSSDLGTRHRAAVGVSEVSDAFVVVVSEESGMVSIAKDGRLHRNLADAEMRKMLLSGIQPKKSRKFRKDRRKEEERP